MPRKNPPPLQDGGMTPVEFKRLVGKRRMEDVANLLGRSLRTCRRYAAGDTRIAPPVAKLIRLLLR